MLLEGMVSITNLMACTCTKTARIGNPLEGIPEETLMLQVESLAAQKGLVDIIPILKQGALLAQDPTVFDNSSAIDDATHEVLKSEILHKWRQPWPLYLTIIFCSIGAAVQ